jgi:hypothetical protein
MTTKSLLTAVALTALGCAQMVGDVLGLRSLKAVAQLTQMAPAMKVFTAHRGYETFAARFFIERVDGDSRELIELTRERYTRLRGPYNRRNVYGAAFSYGPLLASDPRLMALHRSVLHHALCAPGTAIREMGLAPARHWRVITVPHRPAPPELPLTLELDCDAP